MATPEGTRAFAAERSQTRFRELGSTGLTVSGLGFGCYRVEDRSPLHRRSLEMALEGGVNLIDTSTNYTDGHSEQLVGQVLSGLDRDRIVVVSKIGYVQGRNLRLAQAREAEGRPFSEMVNYAEGCWHCLSPEFLADQLERSLGRLGLTRLDVCLLHNPEYFLSDLKKRGRAPDHPEFYRRLGRAFDFLEDRVQAGRLGCYGVSSNTIGQDPEQPEATDLERMLKAAGENFRVLQLPLNLLESDPALRHKHAGRTVLEMAAARKLGVLVNRPLNAFGSRGLVRLAEPPEPAGPERDLAELLEARRAHPLAAELEALQHRLPPWAEWRELEDYLRRVLPGDPGWEAVLLELRRRAAVDGREQAKSLHLRLEGLFPHPATLSQKALWTLASLPGVSSVLVGMRRPEYVEDCLPICAWPALGKPLEVLRRFQG